MNLIILRHKKSVVVSVSPIGGIIQAWNILGSNIIFPRQEMVVNDLEKERGGIPVCSPWFGTPEELLANLSPHGLLKNMLMKVVSQSKSSVELSATHNPTTSFPWCITFNTKIHLVENLLTTEHTVIRNKDGNSKPMPVCSGFHDYFRRYGPYDVQILDQNGNELSKAEVIDKQQPSKKFITQNKAVVNLDNIGKVELDFTSSSMNQNYIVVWTDGTKYGCAEFTSGDPNDFNTPLGIYLNPGESHYIKLARKFLAT